jgi:hypothetical protein
VHRFGKHSYSEYLPAAKAEICKAAMCYARSGQVSGIETISPPPVENKNARCEQRAFFKNSNSKSTAAELTADRCACDAADFAAVNTQVVQFAGGHAAEFGDRLTILAPVIEGACYVHDDPLSRAIRPSNRFASLSSFR